MGARVGTIAGIVLIQVLLLGVFIMFASRWLEQSNSAQLERRAEAIARLLAAAADADVSSDATRLRRLAAVALADADVVYVRVRDAAGESVVEQFREPAAVWSTAPGNAACVDCALIEAGVGIGTDGGHVEVGLATTSLTTLLGQAAGKALVIAAVELLLVTVLVSLYAHRQHRRLGHVRAATERIAREGPGLQIDERGGDELGRLAAAFNAMSRQLSDSYAELREALRDSRRLMARVAASEQQKRELVETALDGIITVDDQGCVLDYNPSAERLFGYARADIVGQPLDTWLRLPEQTAGTSAFDLLFDTDEPDSVDAHDAFGRRHELVVLDRAGRSLPIEVTVTRSRTDHGLYRTAFMRDITDRRRYEDMLEDAARRAREASEAKSRFLAAMSHEIRTPLNAILNMNDLLLETDLDEDQRGYAATASDSARSLLSIVNSVLDFSKIEADRVEPAPEPSDPEEIVKSVVDLLAARAQAKDIQLTVFCAPEVPLRLRIDPGLVRQILLNLVGNAIKFTDAGAVRVRLSMQTADAGLPRLCCRVIDTGIGIAEDKQAYLFDEFMQADASNSRRYGGSGLGLAISRRLARLLGGDVVVDSRLGEGSCFTLCLPAEPVPAPAGDGGDQVGGRRSLAEPLCGLRLRVGCADALVAEDLLEQLRAYGLDADVAPLPGRPAADSGCFGQIDLDVPPTGGGVAAGLSQGRRVLLYQVGGQCPLAGADAPRTVGRLRLPVVPSDLFACLTRASEAEAPEAEIGEAAAADDLLVRVAGAASASLPILLAEDSRANQLVATTLLTRVGFRVDVAENGLQAVAAVNRRSYGLVLMDLAMPEMDGLEATGCIRALPGKRGRIPIIAMTANVLADDRQRCLDAGMDDYLPKPIVRRALYEAVVRWLDGAPARPPADAPLLTAGSRAEEHVAVPVAAGAVPSAPAASAAATDDDSPVLDEQAIAALERDLSEELAPGVVATFLDEVAERVEAIARAVAAGDAAAAGEQGHALKGSAATFGAVALRDLAYTIERAGRSGALDDVERELPRLRTCGDATNDALRMRYRTDIVDGA